MISSSPPVTPEAVNRFGLVSGQAAFWLACSLSALSIVLSGVAIMIALVNDPEPVLNVVVVAFVWAIPFPVAGTLILSRQPGNAIGWIFCAIGLLQGINIFAGQYGRYALLARPGSLPAGAEAIWLGSWTWILSLALLTTFLLLLFPDGRLPSPRWRWLAWVSAGGLALTAFPFAVGAWSVGGLAMLCGQQEFEANREALRAICPPEVAQLGDGPLSLVAFIGLAVTGASALASVTSMVVRFRRSSREERQQIKWFVFAGIIAVACVAAMFTSLDYYRNVLTLGILAIPIAVGIAVLRYRLYDIDLLINRALVYGALTACIVGLYVLIVGYLSAVIQVRGSFGVSLVATGIVAIFFAPMRDYLQRGVNRLMYGERDDPYAAVSRLGERLGSTLAPGAVLPAIVETVREAMKLPYVAIELPRGDAFEIAASSGELPGAAGRDAYDATLVVPLAYGGEVVGQLRLVARTGERDLSRADQRLVDDLARHAGIAVHSVRVMNDLRRSREELVLAREEERRRLRRDLHDELAPTLAALGLTAATVGELISTDPKRAAEANERLRTAIRATVGDVRRLVYDLRPPALDELGLVGAIRERVSRHDTTGENLRITIDAPGSLPLLPAAVEVAAYRIVQEALTNVSRHARASACGIRLSALDDRYIEVEIVDDGVGLGTPRSGGVGLSSMRERAAELGGTFEVGPAFPGNRRHPGTRVLARLPLGAVPVVDGHGTQVGG